ncbi:MAG: metal-dependent hydrolase [Bacteroidetes bacterium]|nr:MAG: metal-dependent hydrolase [Bacteroidota bacterium]
MILLNNFYGVTFKADLSKPIEIGIAVQRSESVASFGIAGAIYQDYRDGSFVGNINLGGPCNLETITFTPHGNSTHTECLGHISKEPKFVNDCIQDTYCMSKLWTLSPSYTGEHHPLDFSSCDFTELSQCDALIIRSLPNVSSKINQDYSGENAPYIDISDMKKIVAAGIEHLIIDLPSVDPEWDNGELAAHHIFWNYPISPRTSASITEFAFIPNDVVDGSYLLKLNISNFVSDAAPSRPVLYPIIAG